MGAKIRSSAKIHGTAIIEGTLTTPPINPEIASAYAMFFPDSRYPGGVGGQTWRVVARNGYMNGKPTYGYGDEIILWNNTLGRWEMNNAYQGTISWSPEDVAYPWLAVGWFYGAGTFDPSVFIDAIAP